MKIERLDENSIRCTLYRDDLDSRELKISELAYGTEKAKNLFKDMIAQASFECGFEAEDIPLMIEAIPVSSDCIVLVITKVTDPEELDTRFSRFSPDDDDSDFQDDIDDDEYNDLFSDDIFEKMEAAPGKTNDFVPFLDSFKKSLKNPETSSDADEAPLKPAFLSALESPKLEKMYSFASMDEAGVAAKAVCRSFGGNSVLYKNPSNSRFYLYIHSDKMKPDAFTGISNTLMEYGKKEKFSYASLPFMTEHFEVIIKEKAVGILAKYFG